MESNVYIISRKKLLITRYLAAHNGYFIGLSTHGIIGLKIYVY